MRLAVDAMGGDLGPRVPLQAAYRLAHSLSDIHIKLFGDFAELADFAAPGISLLEPLNCTDHLPNNSIIEYCHAPQVVTMSDKPGFALRRKQQSSMWMALEDLRAGGSDACVSAGNTGALLAMSRHLLKTFPGIDRPAISKLLPTADKECLMLDLGASVKCDSEHLLQNALMGSVFMTAVAGRTKPSVALLNIGSEDIKGNEQIRLAANLLEASDYINYIGYIEGDEIYSGRADVVVCDGFVGNVALKVSEGVARLLIAEMKKTFVKSWYGRLVGRFAQVLLRQWQGQFEPGRYNGASFLGLHAPVIKSHGGADENAFYSALTLAAQQVNTDVAQKIYQQFERDHHYF